MSDCILSFNVLSGGNFIANLSKCLKCDSKACIGACNRHGGGNILKLNDGKVALKVSAESAAKGACIECMCCELDCQREGQGAIKITLNMPTLDKYLEELGKSSKEAK